MVVIASGTPRRAEVSADGDDGESRRRGADSQAVEGARPVRKRGRPAVPAVTERDRAMLAWLGRHRFATAKQVQAKFQFHQRAVYARLAKMAQLGLVEHHRVLYGEPGVYITTKGGLAIAGVDFTPATIDMRTYWHTFGLVTLATELEAVDDVEAVLTEREIRAADSGASERRELQYAVWMGQNRATGAPRLHFPDLVVRRADGQKEAIEYELNPKQSSRLKAIISGYVRARHLTGGVTYHTPKQAIAKRIEAIARRLDAQDLVRVRMVEDPRPSGRVR